MWPWYLIGLVAIGAIVARENFSEISRLLKPSETRRNVEETSARPRPQAEVPARAPAQAPGDAQRREAQRQAQAPIPKVAVPQAPTPRAPIPEAPNLEAPTPDQRPGGQPAPAAAGDTAFFYCGIRKDNCVVDGGNFIYQGAAIRLADIYVPATKEAKCDRERNLGGDAKEALRLLLNAGRFELAAWKPIGEDQHGRKLRIVVRDGKSIGDTLVAKGLARPWSGQREPWCP